MSVKLFFEAIIKVILGILLVGLLVFLPAGTFEFWNGWLFMGLLCIPMIVAGFILMFKNPELLKRRLDNKEKVGTQKLVILLSGLMFIGGFIVAGLNYRYNWNTIPNIVVYIASGLFIFAYLIYAEVLRENTYLSRTVKVEEGQEVIDTGLYGIIRHPMYAATILLFIMMPLILGSLFSLIIFLLYPIIIIVRINNEEKVLEEELKGYKEYKEKVKYRLLPYIW